jgi:hypothetical protein
VIGEEEERGARGKSNKFTGNMVGRASKDLSYQVSGKEGVSEKVLRNAWTHLSEKMARIN